MYTSRRRKKNKKKIILLISSSFDFFYIKKIIKLLIKRKSCFEIWSLNFKSKGESKKYLIPKNKEFLGNQIFPIRNNDEFIEKIKKSKNYFFLSCEPLIDDQKYRNELFLNKVRENFGIIQKGDDFFLNLINTKSLDLNTYKPILFAISKHKYIRAIKFLKDKINSKKILTLNKLKKIYSGYFYLEKFDIVPSNLKYLIYLPHYSTLSWKSKFFSHSLAFNKFFERKRKDENIIKFFFKKIFQVLFILSSFRSINIFLFENEQKVLKKVFKFCKTCNLSFVIKARKKNEVYNYFKKYSDKIIIDDHKKQNPNYLEELLPNCQLAICYSSQTIYECIYNNVPVINLDNLYYTLIERDIPIIDVSTNGEFNYKNLIFKYSVASFLKNCSIENINKLKFSMSNKKIYLNKFLNIKKNFNGEKEIISYIENC